MTSNQGSFLRDDTKNWISSSLFFYSLNKLGVNCERYYIPPGVTCTQEQLQYYTDELLDEISRLEFTEGNKEHKEYVRRIVFILRSWGRAGYGMKVV